MASARHLGNGFALLKAFARTGDERWLERARRFAVHALGQAERLPAANGRGRYSLWTGESAPPCSPRPASTPTRATRSSISSEASSRAGQASA